MTGPTLDELLAEERADQEVVRFTDAMYERTCANADRVPSRVVKERDRARATAVDLEQRLAEVERIARAWVADGEDEFTTQITLGQLERADAGMAILAAINADHGGDS